MLKNVVGSVMPVRLVRDYRRQTVVVVVALVAVVAALLALAALDRPAAAQSEPQTVGQVGDLTATAAGQPDGTVHLAWNAADHAQVYMVLFVKHDDAVAGNYANGQMRAFTATQGTISGLDGGAKYYFIVRGMRFNGVDSRATLGAWSNVAVATPAGVVWTPSPTPAKPEPKTVGRVAGLTATAAGQPPGAVRLGWKATANAQVYLVRFVKRGDAATGNYANAQLRAFTATQGVITGLDGGAQYDFTARGVRFNWTDSRLALGAWSTAQSATPTRIPGRAYLYETIKPPMAPAYIDWRWQPGQSGFRELSTDFTIHNDVGDWSDEHGHYLILMQNDIAGVGLYFGLQTDANRRGKGVIFSRWQTDDLANARWDAADGWHELGKHEGGFLGVRRAYDWGAGDYRVTLAPHQREPNGEWFGLWITDLAADETTWIGSLKFPLRNGTATFRPRASATIELYGNSRIRPIDVPEWRVSVKRPLGNGVPATWGFTSYPFDDNANALPNSDVRYDTSADLAHLQVGGTTKRQNAAVSRINFKPLAIFSDLERAAGLERDKPALANQLKTLAWIADGVDESEHQAAEELIKAALWYPDVFSALMGMPWVKDDSITTAETRAIDSIRGSAYYSPLLSERMLQKHWVQDDITRDEGIIIRRLSWLAGRKDEATQQRMTDVAISIIDMPFLDDVTFAEARAVMSLHYLAGSRYRDSFRTIMSHPKVQDGITDQEAKVISVLRTSAHYTPEAIPHLLDGLDGTGGVYLEERIIQLPLTGATLLTIVRTKNRTTDSMGYLEDSVRFAENLMAAPLPTNYVALYYGSLGPRYGANNWWTHMAITQSGDGLEEYARTITHEVGHYYFRDASATWINEGTANIIHILAEYERTGSPLETHLKNRSCDSSVKTLAASELIEESGCARNLGERFFVDLYRTLGEDAFLQGFRTLYRMRLVDNPDDDCFECTELTFRHVEAAFKDGASPEVIAKVDKVIDRWYYGTAPKSSIPLADRIEALPWLADGVTEDERQAVNALRNILQESPAVAETLLGFPWLADGVTRDESLVVYHLQVILREDPTTAETLLSFPWFPDGVAEDEMYALYNLREILREDAAAAEALLNFPWLADGVTRDESNAVYNLREILREDAVMAETLLDFPWIADGVTGDESYALYNLQEILRKDPAMANTLLGFPWFPDGLNENESRAVRDVRYILQEDPAIAETVLGSPWFSDGVTQTESQTLWGLRNLYELDHSSISVLTAKPWFKDGLTNEEFMLVGDLGGIAYRSETHFMAIIGMPFLETFEPADALAARSLRRLACCPDSSDDETGDERVSKEFRRVMVHPTISDGISNEEARIVATLHGARFFNPDIFDQLLDPDTVTLEDRTVDLPHTGETQFTIVRIRPGVERTMDLLERTVRTVEGFVAMPFPVRHVIFLAENTQYGAGIDLSGMSGEHEQFDTDERPEIDALHVLAHETAHYYWFAEWSRHWVEDGLGAFFQSLVIRQAEVGPSVPVVPIWPPKMPPCPYMSTIAERDRELDIPGVRIISDCSDSLGERLFQDLWRSLGDSIFRQGLANLHVISRSGAPVGECEFKNYDKAGICEVVAAFKAAAPPEAAAIVDKVIGRWYDNSEPYDLSHVDTSPPNPKLPGGVEITQSYISLDRDRREETRTDSFSASEIRERVFLHLHLSSPTVQLSRRFPLTFVTYFEDGFAYKDNDATYTRNGGWTQTSLSFPIGAGPGYTWIPVIHSSQGAQPGPETPTWAPGRHWVQVYHEGQKVAEVEFQVTP